MLESLLVANRGEIAVRVLRTARRLGLRTIAVYSDIDAHAMHVAMADEAVCIGAAPAAASYLRIDAILAAASSTRAAAIHPGYGFLSENAAFAEACAAAGVVFVGPPVGAIRAMGSKSESKRLMEGSGVPLVPGYHGEDQALATLSAAAQRIGYPLLVKASAGGGGKGMRVVAAAGELAAAIDGARREAKSAFGDDRLLLEKYFASIRHVEVQVFADTQGNCLALHERDCSIQRRHQKVIEEAPAPGLAPEVRERMAAAAVRAARAVAYVGAGTVEFLYANGEFFFIEMNTRLQVEHPVTEMITGLDLVEWQLRVASGEPLPLTQAEVPRNGHAFEARIYAEDPARNFMPSPGRIVHLRAPDEGAHVRIDSGVRSGDEISVNYDPLIAKLIVWDADRGAALRQLRRALEAYEITGVATNVGLLHRVASHPQFAAAEIETRFIERHDLAAAAGDSTPPLAVLALAALWQQLGPQAPGGAAAPWAARDGWRLNAPAHVIVELQSGAATHRLGVEPMNGGFSITSQQAAVEVLQVQIVDDQCIATVAGSRECVRFVDCDESGLTAVQGHRSWRLLLADPIHGFAGADSESALIVSPMPGVVVSVLVEAGQTIERGAPLIAVEAMKMEHMVRAPRDGRIAAVRCRVGDRVSEGVELVSLDAV